MAKAKARGYQRKCEKRRENRGGEEEGAGVISWRKWRQRRVAAKMKTGGIGANNQCRRQAGGGGNRNRGVQSGEIS